MLKKWYPLFIILAIAAAFRLKLLLGRGDFWFDEVYVAHFSVLPWKEFIKYAITETNPPLYTLLMRGWIGLFGQSDILMRLPSFIFGLTTIAATYALAQKIFNRSGAITAGLIYSLAGTHIFLSTENRIYALLSLLSILSFWWFYKIFIIQQAKPRDQYLYLIIQVLLLYSHLTAILIPLFQIAIIGYLKIEQEKKRRFWKNNISAALVYAVWLLPAGLQKINANLVNGWYFSTSENGKNILDGIINLFATNNPIGITSDNHTIFTLLAIVGIALLYLIINTFQKESNEKNKALILYLLLWALVPPFLAAMLGKPIAKFFAFSIPAYCFLTAMIANARRAPEWLSAIIIVPLLLPSALLLSDLKVINWSWINDVTKTADPNSIIITDPFFNEMTLRRYYQGNIPIIGAYLLDDNRTLAERAARDNWKKQIVTASQINNWMDKTTNHINTIYLLEGPKIPPLMDQWFDDHDWKLKKINKEKNALGLYLYEFQAPPDNSNAVEPISTSTTK